MAIAVKPQDQVGLTPVATPVSGTYSTPAGPAVDQSWGDLAQSLATITPELDRIAKRRQGEQDELDKVQAEADFHKNNQVGYAEGVKAGVIPPNASKAYMEAYKSTEGTVAGMALAQKFSAAYDQWDKTSAIDNPNAYNEFASKFFKDHLPANADPRVLSGLMPQVRAITQNGQTSFVRDVSNLTKQKAEAATVAAVDQTVDGARQDALADGKKEPDWKGMVGVALAQRDKLVKAGHPDPDKLDNQLTDVMTTKAVTARDPKLLDAWFDTKVPGRDYTFGQTAYGREQRVKAVDSIATLNRQDESRAYTKKQREDREALDRTQGKMIEAINANPMADLPEDLLAQGSKLDGKFRIDALGWKKTLVDAKGVSDPEQLLALNAELMAGQRPANQIIWDGLNRGVFRDPKDLTAATGFAKSIQEAKPGMDKIRQSSLYTQFIDAIKGRTSNPDDLSKLGIAGVGMSDTGFKLRQEMDVALLNWKRNNPNADDLAESKAINEIGQQVLSRIQQQEFGTPTATTGPVDVPGAAQTTRPGATPGQTRLPPPPGAAVPQPGATTPPVAPGYQTPPGMPSVPGPRAAAPDGTPVRTASLTTPGALPPVEKVMEWYSSLDAEDHANLKRTAQAMGITVTQAAQQFMGKYVAGSGKAAAPAAAPGPQAAAPSLDVEALNRDLDVAAYRLPDNAEDGPDLPAPVMQAINSSFERALGGARTAGPSQGTYAVATIKDDPAAAHILDFVAGPESKGNYNAFFGNAGSTKDLSQMSMGELRNWMGNRGTRSSATGRYQFMKATLFGDPRTGAPGLAQRLGVSDSDKFTPELQDKLAIQLLKDRGYDKWRTGKMTDTQFALNLAKEWASLPDPRTGRSYYAGDGLNKHLVSGSQTQGALNTARRATNTQVASKD